MGIFVWCVKYIHSWSRAYDWMFTLGHHCTYQFYHVWSSYLKRCLPQDAIPFKILGQFDVFTFYNYFVYFTVPLTCPSPSACQLSFLADCWWPANIVMAPSDFLHLTCSRLESQIGTLFRTVFEEAVKSF